MNTLILVCSHRQQSNSARVGQFVERYLTDRQHQTTVVDLGKNPLPMWTPQLADGTTTSTALEATRKAVDEADALVCLVPEYSGMATPAFKNFILMMSDAHLGHKPALLVGVSAGMGGAYPIAEVRMSSYKNVRLLWIPENVLVRFAEGFPDKDHGETVKRMEYALNLLGVYAQALQAVRASPVIQEQPYPFGV